jgi:hypothetical protein
VALDQYQEEEEEGGMSFLDHLEALRWHLFRSISAILIFTVIALVSVITWAFLLFVSMSCHLQSRADR